MSKSKAMENDAAARLIIRKPYEFVSQSGYTGESAIETDLHDLFGSRFGITEELGVSASINILDRTPRQTF